MFGGADQAGTCGVIEYLVHELMRDEHGVFVLQGNHFFWHDRRQGEQFIRVALARDADMFREAATLLGEVCRKVAGTARVGR